MAHQIVATSVPRGLDGVSGYQTVLKSAGIPPRVFDRLKNRSGYSHRFPHGDSRNPVVYVHRVEELAGARWHVLGCIRDAGSDHTGRSNFLAHMLAIDAAEARGKPGGPAAAASARGCFLDKWDAPPEPAAAAKTLVAADRPPRAGDAPAWTASGLDPGLAGDLAAAAMANGRVLLVTRPGDDVLALFADAMRLVEPSKRWGVTFNTCAIEDFDGTWKAIRADLAGPGDLRDGKVVLIDLTTKPRGSTGPYAQFARGDAESLPWQAVATVAEPERETAVEGPGPAPGTGGKGPGKGPRDGKTGEGSTKSEDRKTGRRETRRRYEEEEPSGIPWHTLALAGMGLVVLALLLAIPFRDRLVALVQPQPPRPIEPSGEPGAEPSKPPPVDPKDTPEYRTATKIKNVRDRLQAGEKGVTHDTLQASAKELLGQLDDLTREYREEWPEIIKKDAPNRNPAERIRKKIEEVIGQCKAVSEVLPDDSGAKLQDLEQAEKDFKAAASGFAALKDQVEGLETDAKNERMRQKEQKNANDLRVRRQKAFQDFQSLARTVELPAAALGGGPDLGVRPASSASLGKAAEIDLGTFQAGDLVEPKFRIAVPKDTINGNAFKVQVVKGGSPSGLQWEIQYLPPGVAAGGEAEKPRTLATLVARDEKLFLDVPKSNELNQAPFALLRRSVILAEAKDPAAPEAAAVVQEIRLVKPTKVRPLVIDLFAEHPQQLKIVPPPGISRRVKAADGSNPPLAIPIESLRLDAEFPGGQKVSHELPKDVVEGSDHAIGSWKSILLAQLGPDLAIEADIQLALRQATLAVETRLTGTKVGGFKKEKIKEFFIDNPDEAFKNFERSFRARIKTGEAFTLDQARKPQGNKDILGWFGRPLVNEDMGMPGHQTVAKSFDLFLKERYDEAAKGMKDGKRPDLPENTAQFYERCQRVKDAAEWKSVFTNRITAWDNWFWPKFKGQWDANKKLFQGAVAQRHEIRITAITSLAYDESGKVYEVPLVVLEETPASPAGAGPTAPAGPAVGLD